MMEHVSETIIVKVLFFGAARDAAGLAEVSMETNSPASVSTIKQDVYATYRNLSRFAKSLMVAVNEEYASDDTAVNNSDVVAFLPPVSGG